VLDKLSIVEGKTHRNKNLSIHRVLEGGFQNKKFLSDFILKIID
jgi:hypothetical protein